MVSQSVAVLILRAGIHRSWCFWMQPQRRYVVILARHIVKCVGGVCGLVLGGRDGGGRRDGYWRWCRWWLVRQLMELVEYLVVDLKDEAGL
jgi:hypothetical protein